MNGNLDWDLYFSQLKNRGIGLFFLKKLGFAPCKAEQPLQSMELQEKETQKD